MKVAGEETNAAVWQQLLPTRRAQECGVRIDMPASNCEEKSPKEASASSRTAALAAAGREETNGGRSHGAKSFWNFSGWGARDAFRQHANSNASSLVADAINKSPINKNTPSPLAR